MGSPSITVPELDYWGPVLIVVSDLPSWVRSRFTSVTLTWNQSVCGVMGHTPLPLCPPSVCTVMSCDFRCAWVRSDSCTPEWPKFGTTTIPMYGVGYNINIITHIPHISRMWDHFRPVRRHQNRTRQVGGRNVFDRDNSGDVVTETDEVLQI